MRTQPRLRASVSAMEKVLLLVIISMALVNRSLFLVNGFLRNWLTHAMAQAEGLLEEEACSCAA